MTNNNLNIKTTLTGNDAENNGEETSGFIQAIPNDTITQPLPTQNDFTNIHECYRAKNGHTCLFSAIRYGKKYMLKALKQDYANTPMYHELLKKEFDIAMQLDHPHICRTIGMEQVKGLGNVIVMEHVDGDTLATMLNNGSLDKMLCRKIASQLAAALEYMHCKQIVHRDLKPANIMVTHNGHNVKLIDFSLSDGDSYNILKTPAGTSGYIAPEQLLPEAVADIRSDIYSFGKVLKDMADATGDKGMRRIANTCTRHNVDDRPANIRSIKFDYSIKIMPYVIAVILTTSIIGMLADIGIMLMQDDDNIDSPQQEQPIPEAGDGNHVGV